MDIIIRFVWITLKNQSFFEAKWFKQWCDTEGNQIIAKIFGCLQVPSLDNKVESFTELYRRYIDSALEYSDEQLLLDNLFSIPEQMQREFGLFGFIYQEAATRETEITGEQWSSH